MLFVCFFYCPTSCPALNCCVVLWHPGSRMQRSCSGWHHTPGGTQLNSPTRCSTRPYNYCTLLLLFLWYWEAQIVIEIHVIARPYRNSRSGSGDSVPTCRHEPKESKSVHTWIHFCKHHHCEHTHTHTLGRICSRSASWRIPPLFTLRPGNESHLSIITVRGLRWPGLRPLWNWSGIMAISSAHCVPVTMEAVDVMDNFGRKEDLISQMRHGKTLS